MTMSTNFASAKRGLPRTRSSRNFDMSSEPRLSRSATRPCTHTDGCHLSAERGAAKLSFRVLGDGGPFAFCGAVSCPANASATTGFILSTIDVGSVPRDTAQHYALGHGQRFDLGQRRALPAG